MQEKGLATLAEHLEQTSAVQFALDPISNPIVIPFWMLLIIAIAIDSIILSKKIDIKFNYSVIVKIYTLVLMGYFVFLYWIFLSYNTETIQSIAAEGELFNTDESYLIPSRSLYQLLFIILSGLLYWAGKVLLVQVKQNKLISLSIVLFTGYVIFSFSIVLTGIYFSDLSYEAFSQTYIPAFTAAILEVLLLYTLFTCLLIIFNPDCIIRAYEEHID